MEMSFFNYTNCKKCKSEMTDVKVKLNYILPASICDKICEYIFPCNKCRWLMDKEKEFTERHLPKNHNYTNVEIQMLIIDKYFPFRISMGDGGKIVKYHIEQVIEKDEVKKRFIKQQSRLSIKSFCKKHCRFIQCLIPLLFKKQDLKIVINAHREKIFNRDYKYRNKYSSVEAIIWLFFNEYIRDRIYEYFGNIDFEKTEGYLNEIFDKNNYPLRIDM